MTVAQAVKGLSLKTLKLELEDSILTVFISRPEALNALSQEVISDLRNVFEPLRNGLGPSDSGGNPDWSIRGVIITGEGDRSFVAGGDIAEMSKMVREETIRYASDAQELTEWFETLPIPVIAAVNGFALGGGTELAMACDMIFAAENASFGQPEVQLGLIPGFGGTVRLQKLVGPQLALDLIMSGRRITAVEAKDMGLVARIYPSVPELIEGAKDYLELVKKQSPTAVSDSKKIVSQVAHLSTTDGLKIELEAFADRFETADMLEGTNAFLEKRKPDFKGI